MAHPPVPLRFDLLHRLTVLLAFFVLAACGGGGGGNGETGGGDDPVKLSGDLNVVFSAEFKPSY